MFSFQEQMSCQNQLGMALCLDGKPIHAVRLNLTLAEPSDADREECKSALMAWFDEGMKRIVEKGYGPQAHEKLLDTEF